MYPARHLEKYNSEAKLRRRFELGIKEVLLPFVKISEKKILGIDRRMSVNVSGSTGVGRGFGIYSIMSTLNCISDSRDESPSWK